MSGAILNINSLKFETTNTNFVSIVKNSSDGVIDLISNAGTVLFKNATDPVDAQDLATKNYVDSQTGSVPGGTTGSVQYNNTTFSGTSEFLYNGTRTITLGSENNTSILQIPNATTATYTGGSLNILTGSGNGTGAGGNISILAGTGGNTDGSGGNIYITAGSGGSTNGNGGNLTLGGGSGTGSGTSGNIIATTPVLVPGGSTSAPSYSFSGDTDTGIFSDVANEIVISAGNNNISRMSNSQIIYTKPLRLNDGTQSSPAYSFSGDTDTGIYRDGDGVIKFTSNNTYSGGFSGGYCYGNSGFQSVIDGSQSTPSYSFQTYQTTGIYATAGPVIRFSVSSTNNVNILQDAVDTSSGIITINKTQTGASGTRFHVLLNQSGTVNQTYIACSRSGTIVGSAAYTGTGFSWFGSSDYRLKKDVDDLNDGLTIINKLKPRKYKMIDNDQDSFGFVAHEVKEIIPDGVVLGEKDAVDSEGNIQAQGIAYSNFTPYLTLAIQELHKMVRNINTKTITDVGSGDVILTAEQVMSGIIKGNPSGTRTWTLPAASDIIPLVFQPFQGQIITAVFNNNSTTKSAIIALGSGMTTESGIFKINGHGTENSISSLTLMFRFDNIISGTESITVFKN